MGAARGDTPRMLDGLLGMGECMWQERLNEFVTLFLVLNPISVLPVFIALTTGLDQALQRRIAITSVLVSLGVMLFFMIAGGFVLEKIGVSLRAFQIAGGIVLFVFALEMVRGTVSASAPGAAAKNPLGLAIYPLAIPKIAGPGSMLTAVLLTDDHRFDFGQLWMTALVLVAVLAIQLVLLFGAGPISRLIGESGAGVIGRVMGMLLASLAVTMVLNGVGAWLGLPKL